MQCSLSIAQLQKAQEKLIEVKGLQGVNWIMVPSYSISFCYPNTLFLYYPTDQHIRNVLQLPMILILHFLKFKDNRYEALNYKLEFHPSICTSNQLILIISH